MGALGGFDGLPAPDGVPADPEQAVMAAPTEMLFLDSQGNLFTKNSVNDVGMAAAFDKQWNFQVDQAQEEEAEEEQNQRGDKTPEELLGNDKKKGKKKGKKNARNK